jgi:GldM C-terminal domain
MKKLLVIISFLVYHSAVVSQNISVSADKNNVLYIGVDNPISVVVENYPSRQLIVKAEKGTLIGSNGRIFIYRGVEPGNESIIIYNKENSKEIGRSTFRVKYIPDPVAKVGLSGGGNIQAIVLKNQQFIRAELQNFDFDAMFQIDSFTLNIIRTDTCFFKEVINIGNKFGSAVTEALSSIKKNDIVIFKKISSVGPDGRSRLLSPIVFAITD